MVAACSSVVVDLRCSARVARSRGLKLEEGEFYILGEEPVADQQDSTDEERACQVTGLKKSVQFN